MDSTQLDAQNGVSETDGNADRAKIGNAGLNPSARPNQSFGVETCPYLDYETDAAIMWHRVNMVLLFEFWHE